MTPIPRLADTILLADDEPYNLGWLVEFIVSKGLKVVNARTVDEAIDSMSKHKYRAVVADLSIPVHDLSLVAPASPQERYPGLAIADIARTRGHLDRQVIIYSVHDDDIVRAESKRLGCTYLLKGRPRQFKEELVSVLSFDPLNQQQKQL